MLFLLLIAACGGDVPISTTTFTPEPITFAFNRNPYVLGQALLEQVFAIRAGTIAIPTAGNSQLVSFICLLPRGYAYVIVELNASLFGTDASDWGINGFFEVQDSITGPRWTSTPMLEGVEVERVVPHRSYQAFKLPNKLILTNGPDSGRIRVEIANIAIDGSAMTFIGYMRVLVFDLAQAFESPANTAIFVR